ncbi:MAG: hypothetical protein LBU00_00770, partial [Treponema sp.]|nr:hypothetical protein [Treponema sp.]
MDENLKQKILKELLEKAFEESKEHKQIFRNEIKIILNDYMSMRHFIRHAYGFRLDWDQMQELTNEIDNIWVIVKEDLKKFIDELVPKPGWFW